MNVPDEGYSRNVSCALRAAHSPYHKDEGFVA